MSKSIVQDRRARIGSIPTTRSATPMARIAAKDRREALIAAAIRVMVREGVTKTTTRKIVQEAGMNLGAFHYCFTSREELLQEVITRITDASLGAAQETIASG